jgi:hypothetical protein
MMDIKDRRKAQGIRRKGVELCSNDQNSKFKTDAGWWWDINMVTGKFRLFIRLRRMEFIWNLSIEIWDFRPVCIAYLK